MKITMKTVIHDEYESPEFKLVTFNPISYHTIFNVQL